MSYDASDPDFNFLAIDKRKIVAEAPAYDGKKNFWIPHPKEGYVWATLLSQTGDNCEVESDKGEKSTLKKELLQEMNPPKFMKIEDMANMTYLNEASVLTNLRYRYGSLLIYTYSGLFCVCVNPYKRLPIYGMNVVNKFKGKKRNEVPPHLFSIADNAYSYMIVDRENQSMLITGESGAGKTENTKKVISYFALVAASQGGKSDLEGIDPATGKKKATLEDQIVQCNPVLEAYGNAKTTRNNNSSRFGKFIRIHFGPSGKIAGCDIETYLLEKSRVTYQQPGVERNYHLFYQLLSNQFPDMIKQLELAASPGDYFYINQGCLGVDGMDDKEECQVTWDSFHVLGFTDEETMSFFKGISAVLHMGEMKFKQRPREEQADCDGTEHIQSVANMMGVDMIELQNCLLKPKVKVGTEYVAKGQNLDQVHFGTSALAKSTYNRMFENLVVKVNKTLDTPGKRAHFIGVLDIAGFEIFDYNTLEQLLINYTNERLQQFFNHHMFVLEQEEYQKEGIVWEFIDFGMDLAACIELIEKPLGILSILEEQCMFPKATEKTLLDALFDNHGGGKSSNFGKPKPNKKATKEPHFELYHYAGTVQYNIEGWLDKNRDPVNQTVVDLMSAAKEPLVSLLFQPPPEPAGGAKKGGKKGGSFVTISGTHKESLARLMKSLYSTHPHFVRCLIPNELKQAGLIDALLVLHQLQCNGVLEGIRICRKGFPNRMIYSEFKQRYSILAPNAVPAGFAEGKEVTGKVLAAINMDENNYRLGNTKVFFRSGVLGSLEDMRDDALSKIIALYQSHIRGYLMRKNYSKMQEQRKGLTIIQRNIRQWLSMRNWQWWKLYTRVKPLLSAAKQEDEMNKKLEELEETTKKLEETEGVKKQLEEQNEMLNRAKQELTLELQTIQDAQAEQEERVDALLKEKMEFQSLVSDMEARLAEEEGGMAEMKEKTAKLNDKISDLKGDLEGTKDQLAKAGADNQAKEAAIKKLEGEMHAQEEAIAKANKEKKQLDENWKKTQEDLAAEEAKVNALNKAKQQLESQIDDMEDGLEREKKAKADLDKVKKKVEQELKMTQEQVEELERVRSDLEGNVKKKDAELVQLSSRLEDEQSLVAQLQKKIKELQARIEELEDELEQERAARSKVEKQRQELSRDLEDVSERLDEAGGQTAAQMDLNKKREAELVKLKRDLEESIVAGEHQVQTLKKKMNDAVGELSEQLDTMTKNKAKFEKERNALKGEMEDMAAQAEHFQKAHGQSSKQVKSLEAQLSEVSAKAEEAARAVNELGGARNKAVGEANELVRQLEEAEAAVSKLTKEKQAMAKALEEAKSMGEDEARVRAKLQSELRALQGDLDSLRENLEEEAEGRAEAQRLMQKASGEAMEWRRKFESGEGGVSGEALDDLKRKMNAKLADLESQLEGALAKAGSLEKARTRLTGELEDVTIEMERAQAIAAQAEKKQRGFDKTIDEWKRKVADLNMELETSSADARSASAEVYKLRAQLDEGHDAIEALRRENKSMADEMHELAEQLGEGGRGVHELEKARKRLEMEKEELQSALEEAEGALEAEEAKVARGQLEIQAIRTEIDRRLAEKDEEFESTRKNHARALDSMAASLEAETRGKAEAMRLKKKLEQDINELEVALDGANRQRADCEKNIKKYQVSLRETQQHVEEEQHLRDEAREAYQTAERKAAAFAGEVEELRARLEGSERARKAAEGELHEASERVTELTTSHTSITAAKRKLENDIQAMQGDLEEAGGELKGSEEAVRKAMADAAKFAEELRTEQEHSRSIEKLRSALESQNKELLARLDEAEACKLVGGKKMIQKLESRVRELEVEYENEQRRHAETTKGLRKQDKRMKELAFQGEEEHKAQARMAEMVEKLTTQIKTYKRQVEEAEEIAAMNLAKYRKVQHELEDAEERADMAENTLQKLRAKNRSSASSSKTTVHSGPGVSIKVTETHSTKSIKN